MRYVIYEKRITKRQQEMIDKFEEVVSLVESNCSEILSLYKSVHKFLYRGITEKTDFIEKAMRTGVRIPRNTDKKTHVRLNKLMKEKFGWKVRDGISTTTALYQTNLYGEAYIFFPFNKYKFCYSPAHYDLWQSIKEKPIGMSDKEWEPKEMKSLKRLVNKHTDQNLKDAFKRDGEVLFKVKKYYMLNQSFEIMARERWGI
jgi:hypothetical protein